MNKQNQFFQNQISTGIQDSCSKSTYSSRFLQTQKKNTSKKKVLPVKYERAAICIQRFWRFRQHMKRILSQKIIDQLIQLNQCYDLQNQILSQTLQQYENIILFKQAFISAQIRQNSSQLQDSVSSIKKQLVVASFKLEKQKPTKQLLSELVHKKQEQTQLNFMLNREKIMVQEQLQEEKMQNQALLKEFKRLNIVHLQFVRQKNELSHQAAQKMLQTSKFGRQPFNLYIN